ncbi:MAG: hypothetical protein Q9169_006459 [Polycauliona sp. 2 TL-2023]
MKLLRNNSIGHSGIVKRVWSASSLATTHAPLAGSEELPGPNPHTVGTTASMFFEKLDPERRKQQPNQRMNDTVQKQAVRDIMATRDVYTLRPGLSSRQPAQIADVQSIDPELGLPHQQDGYSSLSTLVDHSNTFEPFGPRLDRHWLRTSCEEARNLKTAVDVWFKDKVDLAMGLSVGLVPSVMHCCLYIMFWTGHITAALGFVLTANTPMSEWGPTTTLCLAFWYVLKLIITSIFFNLAALFVLYNFLGVSTSSALTALPAFFTVVLLLLRTM